MTNETYTRLAATMDARIKGWTQAAPSPSDLLIAVDQWTKELGDSTKATPIAGLPAMNRVTSIMYTLSSGEAQTSRAQMKRGLENLAARLEDVAAQVDNPQLKREAQRVAQQARETITSKNEEAVRFLRVQVNDLAKRVNRASGKSLDPLGDAITTLDGVKTALVPQGGGFGTIKALTLPSDLLPALREAAALVRQAGTPEAVATTKAAPGFAGVKGAASKAGDPQTVEALRFILQFLTSENGLENSTNINLAANRIGQAYSRWRAAGSASGATSGMAQNLQELEGELRKLAQLRSIEQRQQFAEKLLNPVRNLIGHWSSLREVQ